LRTLRECADALDPILADLRRLQVPENKDDASRVDGERLPAPTGTTAKTSEGDESTLATEAMNAGDYAAACHHWIRKVGEVYQLLTAAEERHQAATARIVALVTALAACEAREQALKDEIATAREACPSIRRQDYFDAPLLTLINKEVSRGFTLTSQVERLAEKLDAMRSGDTASARHKDFEERLQHEADAVIALVHQQQIQQKQIEELERRVSTLSGLVNR
jgi:vacuolar-type H+-ATPase subunit I/STV1